MEILKIHYIMFSTERRYDKIKSNWLEFTDLFSIKKRDKRNSLQLVNAFN